MRLMAGLLFAVAAIAVVFVVVGSLYFIAVLVVAIIEMGVEGAFYALVVFVPILAIVSFVARKLYKKARELWRWR